MNRGFFRNLGVALFLTGVTLSPQAWAQTDPHGQGAPPTVERSVKRNPFVPPAQWTPPPPRPTTPVAHPTPGPTGHTQLDRNVVSAPSFQVAGIYYSSGGVPGALVTAPGSNAVHVGDTVNGYKVTAIDPTSRTVTVEQKNHTFNLQLPAKQ